MVGGSMGEAKSGIGDTIKELVSMKCCGIGIKEGESENFAVDGVAMDLLAKIRKVPVGSIAREIILFELLSIAEYDLFSVYLNSSVDKNKYGYPPSLGIGIFPDQKNKTLSIIDTGIGMDRGDSVNFHLAWTANLTTSNIALEKYLTCEPNVDLHDLYKRGFRLWLGFFSAFMVAYKVVVTTKQEGEDPYVWELNANGNGTLVLNTHAPGGASFRRGTKVTLHLKDGCHEYLRVDKLRELVNKCEQLKHFYPIFLISDVDDDVRLLNEVKEDKVEIEKLKDKYKGVQEAYVEHITRDRAKNLDVIIGDRPLDVACNLNVLEDGRKRPVLEINPRWPDMEKLWKLVESIKVYDELMRAVSSPKDLRLYKMNKKKTEAALKRKILYHFDVALLNFETYDRLNDTCFYEKAAEAIGLDDKYWRGRRRWTRLTALDD